MFAAVVFLFGEPFFSILWDLTVLTGMCSGMCIKYSHW